jgi:hypothetical protein
MMPSKKFYLMGLILWLLFSPLANAASVGAASLMSKIPANAPPQKNSSQVITVREFHQVNTSAPTTVSAYQPYVYCPNGGLYTNGSLTSVTPNLLYYFCDLSIYPWYLEKAKPTFYDAAQTTTYAQVYAGLVANPSPSPSIPSGDNEQISISPAYATGLPTTTIMLDNCMVYPFYSSFGQPGPGVELASYISMGVTVSSNGNSLINATLSAASSPYAQCTYSAYTVTVIPGQSLSITKTPGTMNGASAYPFNAAVATLTSTVYKGQTLYSWSVPGSGSYYLPEKSCSTSYTIQQQDIGQTIGLDCCYDPTGALQNLGYSAPGSVLPAAGGTSLGDICGRAFPSNTALPMPAPKGMQL